MLKNIIYVLTLKKIPQLYWSSLYEYNLKPKRLTIFYLVFGLVLFGLGETLLITASIVQLILMLLYRGVFHV